MLNFENKIKLAAKPNDILTIGELLVDMISADYGDNFESNQYHRYFGGSPANIAMNAKKLGIRSTVVSAVGNDGLGDYLVNHLAKAGLDTTSIQRVDQSTSMVLITKSKTRPIPLFYREADYQLRYTESLEEKIKSSTILHISTWPISKQPSRKTIETCLKTAKDHGLLICLDPNYHPKLWGDEDGVGYIKSMIRDIDIIKPSEDDAERLFGPDTTENYMNKFLGLGAKLVILTLGKDGAIVSNGKETHTFKTMASDVVDATGAGDAFWSGFYAGIVQGETIKDALNLGFAVSAYKLQSMGGVVHLPDSDTIKTLYKL